MVRGCLLPQMKCASAIQECMHRLFSMSEVLNKKLLSNIHGEPKVIANL
jgi:hypothetical protein